jgi:hypothetical protein
LIVTTEAFIFTKQTCHGQRQNDWHTCFTPALKGSVLRELYEDPHGDSELFLSPTEWWRIVISYSSALEKTLGKFLERRATAARKA